MLFYSCFPVGKKTFGMRKGDKLAFVKRVLQSIAAGLVHHVKEEQSQRCGDYLLEGTDIQLFAF